MPPTLPCLALMCLSASGAASQPETGPRGPAPWRSYHEGPLRPDDYQAPVPDEPGRLDAVTTTDIRFDCGYQFQFTPKQTTAWATDLSIDAVVVPGKSWLRRSATPRLRDHEQGHFDITYIAALRARLEVAKRARDQRPFVATAASRQEAIDLLHKNVRAFVKPFRDASLAEQREYDTVTNHGRMRSAQAAQRRRHAETIRNLSEGLKQIRRSHPPTTSRGR